MIKPSAVPSSEEVAGHHAALFQLSTHQETAAAAAHQHHHRPPLQLLYVITLEIVAPAPVTNIAEMGTVW